MCGSTPKERPSAQDIANTAFATYRQNLDTEFGSPLRVRQVEEALDPGLEARETGFFASKANADVAQAGSQIHQQALRNAAASGRGIQNVHGQVNDSSLTLASAASEAKNDAKEFAVARADERRLNAQRIGAELGNTTQNTLSNQASIATNKNITNLQTKQAANQAKAKALGDIVLSGAKIGNDVFQKKQAEFNTDPTAIRAAGASPNEGGLGPRINPGTGRIQSRDLLGRPIEENKFFNTQNQSVA